MKHTAPQFELPIVDNLTLRGEVIRKDPAPRHEAEQFTLDRPPRQWKAGEWDEKTRSYPAGRF